MFYKENKKSGFSALEVIIGSTILSVSLFALFSVLQISMKIIDTNTNNIKAGFLLEETLEAVRILRDSGWSANIASLGVGTSYFLDFDGATWQSTTNNVYVDSIFERKFVLSDAYRDANDDIVASPGVLDTDIKKVTVSVSWWERTSTSTRNISIYITNLFNN